MWREKDRDRENVTQFTTSVTRLGDLLDFSQLFKDIGSN